MWGGYDDTILHRLCNINRILFQGKAAQSYTIKCRAFCDERILYYQNDLGVNMKQLKQFRYSIDNDFMKGVFYTWNERRVRRHLRYLLGWRLYFKVRKKIVIKEVE